MALRKAHGRLNCDLLQKPIRQMPERSSNTAPFRWTRSANPPITAHAAIPAASPRPGETPLGDRAQRSGLCLRLDGNHSNGTSFCWGQRESWAYGRRAAGTTPVGGRSRWVGPAANRVLADISTSESAVSVHRVLFDSLTACLDWQNTADRVEIPGNDGGCPQKVFPAGSSRDPAPEAEQPTLCPTAQSG